jgi:hypothetical protein
MWTEDAIMGHRTTLAIVAFMFAAGFFLFAPIVMMSPGAAGCVPQYTYASLSYVAFGTLGVHYWPATGWVDFPPLYFHGIYCSQ